MQLGNPLEKLISSKFLAFSKLLFAGVVIESLEDE